MTIQTTTLWAIAILAGVILPAISGAVPADGTLPDRPNILWITSEGNSAQWLGCYGNAQAITPQIDGLARDGVRFTRAFSNAPVCAVARSTLLTGVYAPSMGTQHMRSRYPVPTGYRPYVRYLRDVGYYCTNNAKTDFNIKGNDRAIWDECSGEAHYRNRGAGHPFFSIFNLTVSHESSLFPQTVKKNRNGGIIPRQSRLSPAEIDLPPYLPDLPEIRNDFAVYHDVMTAMDTQVGQVLDELQASGLADDTIVFYFSDHGGPTPRGKRYLEKTGVQVPLVIHVPEKWKHVCPFETGSQTGELVSFVDFAPTLLSLAGLEQQPQFQGRPFLGTRRIDPAADAVVFLFGDRFDDIVGMRRGITDGRFKYIRRFTSWLPAAAYSYYPLTMPGWKAWQIAAGNKSLSGYHQEIWETPQPVEQLFDLEHDPWETHNLATEFPSQLLIMQQRLKSEMIAVRDTGLVPEGMFEELASEQPVVTYLKESGFDFDSAAGLAFTVTSQSPGLADAIRDNIDSDDPVFRYWAIVGCLAQNDLAEPFRQSLTARLSDAHACNRIAAAHALVASGQQDAAVAALMAELSRPDNEASSLLLVNTFRHLRLTGAIDPDLSMRLQKDPQIAECIRTMLAKPAVEN